MTFTFFQVLFAGLISGLVISIRAQIRMKQYEDEEWKVAYLYGIWDERNGEASHINNIQDIDDEMRR